MIIERWDVRREGRSREGEGPDNIQEKLIGRGGERQ